jgi:hypothetical protein
MTNTQIEHAVEDIRSQWIKYEDRIYQEKKQSVEKFIKKHGKADHYIILNNVDVGYDTLMNILSDLRNEGRLK